ncbi:DUF5908 family protein [Chitinophaga rhizosphaerae]|uniref:DUF5908 family protein n=1 Tax=Chitinophaga rhizosphaerae TaxID=1864947 RepID=UPI000F809053|nr:DUF5908 family protein [Chitinophaga rhizosphaerae]
MPIEIRELVIRARVEEPQPAPSGPAGTSSGGGAASSSQPDIQQIVAACTDAVMRLLKKQKER